MTFNEKKHPRKTDGKFAAKTGTASGISLAGSKLEQTQALIGVARFDVDYDDDVDSLARELRSEGLSDLSVRTLSSIIKQDRFWDVEGDSRSIKSDELADEILRDRSEDEVAIADHLAGGSGAVWSGKDSTTPEGYYATFGKAGDGSTYTYLLDDETKSIVGRIESNLKPGQEGRFDTRVYEGSSLRGGYYMGAGSPNGHQEIFSDIARMHEGRKAVARVDASLSESSDFRISEYASRAAEGDSTLEHILRHENGINVILRRKLLQAYQSENGRVEVPKLIEENASMIDGDLLRDLRKLAADASQ
jgi:hypothetical protein